MKKKKKTSLDPTEKDLEALTEHDHLLEETISFRVEKGLKKKLNDKKINISKACREYLRKLAEIAVHDRS